MMDRRAMSADMRKLIDTVNQGDYHDYLDVIDDESVDLLLTDVPYNIGYLGKDWDSGDTSKGGFDLDEWIKLISPKVKKTGTAVIFCGDGQVGDLVNGLLANGFGNPSDRSTYPRLFVWHKPNAKDRKPHKRQSKVFESYIVATKSDDNTFNLRIETQLKDKGYEDGLLSYSATEDLRHRIHSTQKPNSLWKSLIEMYSDTEDLILDTFSGSGVTAAMASQMGRYYITIERTRSMYLDSLVRLRLAKLDALRPEYFFGYHPYDELPESEHATINDRKIVDDLLRLQPEYLVMSDEDYIIENEDLTGNVETDGKQTTLTEQDLGDIDFEIMDGKYLIMQSDEDDIELGKSGLMLSDLRGITPVRAIEHTGAKSKTVEEKSTYYQYLWFFLSKLYGYTEDLSTDYSGFYALSGYESPVVNGMMFANNDIEKLNTYDWFDGYSAEEVEDGLKITKTIADKYHLQYLKSRSDEAKSDTTRWRRANGKARPRKVYNQERKEQRLARANEVRQDYQYSALSDKEFLEHYDIAKSTLYIYKKLWAEEDAKAANSNAKLRSEVRRLKAEIRELKK
ncbi:site-specific DNA-methyltransferase [Levilactobacillus tujiorum]|uniref:site-specific DNA-methyltransferase n=1 Tax=Levilactobacillus tujiorum TaxID=2912243 RepID=UPI0014574AF0|nr:site-specific DNA-methyltransferase [Levilactobacillus tujiorum]NLR32827.1 site-specific DNA-methyltransferase [Levilactobacillus tujiorum]